MQTRSVGSVITVKTMCKPSFKTFVVAINYYEAFFAIWLLSEVTMAHN